MEGNLPTIKVLPKWPLSPDKNAGPGIVVGEVHHPVKAVESRNPIWLTIPERGIYIGVAIFGAVRSGKTSACMHLRAANLVLAGRQSPAPGVQGGRVLPVEGD